MLSNFEGKNNFFEGFAEYPAPDILSTDNPANTVTFQEVLAQILASPKKNIIK